MRLIPKTLHNKIRGRIVNLQKKGTISSKALKKARQDSKGIKKFYGVKTRKKFHI